MLKLVDPCVELDLALCTHIARGGASDEERHRIDEAVRAAHKQCPSWEKTHDLVGAAVAESEDLLFRKYPKAQIRARLVAVLYTLHAVHRDPVKPFSIDEFELFQRSRLTFLLRDVNNFADDCSRQPRRPERAESDKAWTGQRGTGEECEQPVLISRHFHWFALVDAESAKTRKAEELTTEALRRAPVTATICITYQVVETPQARDDAEHAQVGTLSLEVVKYQFTYTAGAWQVCKRRK
jgi:hypothetical protein